MQCVILAHLSACVEKESIAQNHCSNLSASSSPSLSGARPLSVDSFIHVIVAEKGKDPQRDSQVISALSGDADLAEFKKAVSLRFAPAVSQLLLPSAISLEDSKGQLLTTFAELSRSRVVYLSRPLAVKETPFVLGYPLLGIVPYIVEDIRGAMLDFFDKHGDTLDFYNFGTKIIPSRDLAVVREMMNDSEYSYKSISFPLSEFKGLAGDGLFTSSSTQDVWKHAHRLLMPAFSSGACIYTRSRLPPNSACPR